MTDKKISDWTAATDISLTDLVPGVIDPGATPLSRKITLEQIRNLLDIDEVFHRADGNPHDDDDEFDGVALSGWDNVLGDNYGNPSVTVSKGALNVTPDGATGDNTTTNVCAFLKPLSGSPGLCTIETRVRALAANGDNNSFGLIMAEGDNAATNDCVVVGFQQVTGSTRSALWTGSMDALTRVNVETVMEGQPLGAVKIRLNWSATDTFSVSYSTNGVLWTDLKVPELTHSITPTFYGLAYGWNTGRTPVFTFDYFRKVA